MHNVAHLGLLPHQQADGHRQLVGEGQGRPHHQAPVHNRLSLQAVAPEGSSEGGQEGV